MNLTLEELNQLASELKPPTRRGQFQKVVIRSKLSPPDFTRFHGNIPKVCEQIPSILCESVEYETAQGGRYFKWKVNCNPVI